MIVVFVRRNPREPSSSLFSLLFSVRVGRGKVKRGDHILKGRGLSMTPALLTVWRKLRRLAYAF